MQINIINKAKTAGITLFALMWVVFASTTPVQAQATSVGEHYVVTNAKTSTTGGKYAVERSMPSYSKSVWSLESFALMIPRLEALMKSRITSLSMLGGKPASTFAQPSVMLRPSK